MERRFAERDRLDRAVTGLLTLSARELSLQTQQERLVNQIRTTLRRATDDRAEVVFVGPSGAGKSTLIKALLGREIFYSGREDFITGTECRLLWAAEASRERAVLTYASLGEVVEELELLCQRLGLGQHLHAIKTDQFQSLGSLIAAAEAVRRTEGGSDRQQSPRARLATALILLARGLTAHYTKIQTSERYQETVTDLEQAAEAMRFGCHSAVLQQVEYYCHEPFLQQSTLVDLPGWDAPLAQGAQLALEKVRDPDVAAIVCVLPVTATGELAATDSEFVATLQGLPGASERIFWALNCCDRVWSNERARQTQRALKAQIASDRSCDTCAILGYYSPMLAVEIVDDRGRNGIDALNAVSLNPQETQLFKKVLLDYYSHFYGQRAGSETIPLSDDLDTNFLRVVGTAGSGQAVMEAATAISGIPQLKHALATYVLQERRAHLGAALTAQIQTLGLALMDTYVRQARELVGQPEDLPTLEGKLLFKELETLRYSLREIVQDWAHHLRTAGPDLLPTDLCVALTNRLRDRLQTYIQEQSLPTLLTPAPSKGNRTQMTLAFSLDAIAGELEAAACAEIQAALTACRDLLLAQMSQRRYHTLAQTLAVHGPELLEAAWQEAVVAAERALLVAVAIECDRYGREIDTLHAVLTTADLDALTGGKPLAAEREAPLRHVLTEDTMAKAAALGAYLERALQLTLERSLLALVSESSQFQLYDRLSDLCRAQLERETAVKAREQQLENRRLKREIADKVERYHQFSRDIGSALQALGIWEFTLPEVPATELPWVANQPHWPSSSQA